MATAEQVQEMMNQLSVAGQRIERLEREANAVADERRASQARIQQLEAAAATGGKGKGAGGLSIDARQIGKPEIFDGTGSKFRDWSIVFRSYATLANPLLGDLLRRADAYTGSEDDEPLNNASMNEVTATASRDLYHLLLSLCRGVALDKVINATEGEGATAWSMLVSRYEPKLKTRQAGLLMSILKFDFGGDVLARLETFERDCRLYQKLAGTGVEDNLKIGIALSNMADGALKEHLIMSAERLRNWELFRAEMESISRVKQFAGAVPMDVDAMTKGSWGKGGKPSQQQRPTTCHNCGQHGHWSRDCPKGKGKGYKGKGSKGKGKKGKKGKSGKSDDNCRRCGQPGHYARNCTSSRPLLTVEEEFGATDDSWWSHDTVAWTDASWHDDGGWHEHSWAEESSAPAPPPGQTPTTTSTAGASSHDHMFGGFFLNCIAEQHCGRDGLFCGECESSSSLDAELNALEVNTLSQSCTFTVDSGAALSCCGPSVGADYPCKPAPERKLRTATGALVADYGNKELCIDAGGQDGIRMIKAASANVSKNLLSVSELIDRGHDVVFSRRASYIQHEASGRRIPLVRRNGVFELETKVLPHTEAQRQIHMRSSSAVQRPNWVGHDRR